MDKENGLDSAAIVCTCLEEGFIPACCAFCNGRLMVTYKHHLIEVPCKCSMTYRIMQITCSYLEMHIANR